MRLVGGPGIQSSKLLFVGCLKMPSLVKQGAAAWGNEQQQLKQDREQLASVDGRQSLEELLAVTNGGLYLPRCICAHALHRIRRRSTSQGLQVTADRAAAAAARALPHTR
jgi:hypothetical protein